MVSFALSRLTQLSPARLLLLGLIAAVIATQALVGNPLLYLSERSPVWIGMDSTSYRCLPWRWYLLRNRSPESIERGDMVQVLAQGLEPVAADGKRMVKIVAAVPGDTYRSTPEGVWINGAWFDEVRVPEAVRDSAEKTVPEGHVLVMGVTEYSFDGRYFGTLPQERVIGTASPLFAASWDKGIDEKYDEQTSYRFGLLLDGSPGTARAEQGGHH